MSDSINIETQGHEDLVLLSEFLGMSSLLKRQSTLTQTFDHLLAEASRLTNAQQCTLYFVDHPRSILASYIGQKSDRLQIRLPIGQGMAGHVASSGKPILTNTPYDEPSFDASWDNKTGFKTESLLTVPIRLPNGTISGVLQAVNATSGSFTHEDTQTLSTFATHMGIAIENLCLYEDLKLTLRSTMRALAASIDSRDPVTAGHTERVTFYSVQAAQLMGLSTAQLTTLELAASLHDIGKIGVPDAILQKPGRLTNDEYEIIKRHARIGRDILQQVYFSPTYHDVPFLAGAHHERLDGSGYPDGLIGGAIPIEARIMAVADVFDAVTAHDRPYRAAMTIEEGLALIDSDVPTKLDPEVVAAFHDQSVYQRDASGMGELLDGQRVTFKLLPCSYGCDLESLRHMSTMEPVSMLFLTRSFLPSGSRIQLSIEDDGKMTDAIATVDSIERIGRTAEFEVLASLRVSSQFDRDRILKFSGTGANRQVQHGSNND